MFLRQSVEHIEVSASDFAPLSSTFILVFNFELAYARRLPTQIKLN
jgi:hypothetical protein